MGFKMFTVMRHTLPTKMKNILFLTPTGNRTLADCVKGRHANRYATEPQCQLVGSEMITYSVHALCLMWRNSDLYGKMTAFAVKCAFGVKQCETYIEPNVLLNVLVMTIQSTNVCLSHAGATYGYIEA